MYLALVCATADGVCLPPQLTNTIMDIVQQAANYKQLKKGANEGAYVSWCCAARFAPRGRR
jgi:hypothetical protein